MARFVQSLVAVVEANQRFLLRRLTFQLFLVLAAGFGLWHYSGVRWLASLLVLLVGLLGVTLGALQLKLHLTMKVEPPWRAVGLRPPVSGDKERVLQLHLMEGGVQLLAVPADLVADLLSAAKADGIEVFTDHSALEALNLMSARLERLHDLEALIPFVPTPELRGELKDALERVGALQPDGCDEALRELEIQLMAEKDAQTTTSLRGPKPVFESEIREKLSRLTSPLPNPFSLPTPSPPGALARGGEGDR